MGRTVPDSTEEKELVLPCAQDPRQSLTLANRSPCGQIVGMDKCRVLIEEFLPILAVIVPVVFVIEIPGDHIPAISEATIQDSRRSRNHVAIVTLSSAIRQPVQLRGGHTARLANAYAGRLDSRLYPLGCIPGASGAVGLHHLAGLAFTLDRSC